MCLVKRFFIIVSEMLTKAISHPHWCLAGHINNQYNTCFWMLVKSGKSKSEAQNCLKVLSFWKFVICYKMWFFGRKLTYWHLSYSIAFCILKFVPLPFPLLWHHAFLFLSILSWHAKIRVTGILILCIHGRQWVLLGMFMSLKAISCQHLVKFLSIGCLCLLG